MAQTVMKNVFAPALNNFKHQTNDFCSVIAITIDIFQKLWLSRGKYNCMVV